VEILGRPISWIRPNDYIHWKRSHASIMSSASESVWDCSLRRRTFSHGSKVLGFHPCQGFCAAPNSWTYYCWLPQRHHHGLGAGCWTHWVRLAMDLPKSHFFQLPDILNFYITLIIFYYYLVFRPKKKFYYKTINFFVFHTKNSKTFFWSIFILHQAHQSYLPIPLLNRPIKSWKFIL
jgi:hypothetical protein